MRRRSPFAIPLLLAAIISIALFTAGLFSGLYANKVVAERQAADSAFLRESVESLERELQAYQLQERFLDSLSEEQGCPFAKTYFERTVEGLEDYWQVLPDRLEEYERGRELSPEYVALKERYIIASLRTWIIARRNYHVCGNDPIPLLYFYSQTCENCLQQGQALDGAREAFAADARNLVIFTIDAEADVPAIELIRDYYGVKDVPAIVVGESVHQGSVLGTEDIVTMVLEEDRMR
jgi:hypothetical protein